jgi:hypothetical protein
MLLHATSRWCWCHATSSTEWRLRRGSACMTCTMQWRWVSTALGEGVTRSGQVHSRRVGVVWSAATQHT